MPRKPEDIGREGDVEPDVIKDGADARKASIEKLHDVASFYDITSVTGRLAHAEIARRGHLRQDKANSDARLRGRIGITLGVATLVVAVIAAAASLAQSYDLWKRVLHAF